MDVTTYTRIVRTIPEGTGSKIEPFDFHDNKWKKWFIEDKKENPTAEYELKTMLS